MNFSPTFNPGKQMTSPAAYIDHTLLKPDAGEADIGHLCEEAVEQEFASVCIPPMYVAAASRLLYGSGVAVGTVVGFPLGYETSRVKAFQTAQAIEAGADEIDMVIALGAAREGRFDIVREDIQAVVTAAEGQVVKVIIETCLFPEAVKRRLTEIVVDSGAAFVKTSTGFAAGGATVDDVALLHSATGGAIGVKASGGVRDWPTCQAMLKAGATRIGTSNGLAVMEGWRRAEGLPA